MHYKLGSMRAVSDLLGDIPPGLYGIGGGGALGAGTGYYMSEPEDRLRNTAMGGLLGGLGGLAGVAKAERANTALLNRARTARGSEQEAFNAVKDQLLLNKLMYGTAGAGTGALGTAYLSHASDDRLNATKQKPATSDK